MAQESSSSEARSARRGFAAMDPARQRAIAAAGGRAAHAQGVAHEFDSAEARVAGRKGGQARGARQGDGDRDVQRATATPRQAAGRPASRSRH